ncbi:PEP-CTERM sorting domain-containing protein [Microcoleus sp. AT9b-C4]
MNNFYHKVTVASVCTTLGFALGASPEAKAVSLTFPPATIFEIMDEGRYDNSNFDGLGDVVFPASDFSILAVARATLGETRSFTEFNIGSFSWAPNTVISRAVLQTKIYTFSLTSDHGIETPTNPGSLGIFGYIGNGTAEASDFETGVFLNSVDVSSSSAGDILNFNVTPFVNQRISNGDAFAGFGIRALNFGGLFLENYSFQNPPRLIVETADVAEPVPEPTAIFGSAIALGLGGWLKRKKSNQQNKTTPQR